MHFAGIDLPDKLVAAHADGKVVFFVGAGASMPPPTKLPNFAMLTRDLVSMASVDVPDEQIRREPDVVLGQLEQQHRFPVHELVAKQIARGRVRNRMHDALAMLAAAPGTVRLVTTNYDNHLQRAFKVLGHKPVVFEAPALPAGGDFEGLVHLHGRLGQLPRRLVITDSDFSRGYITEGWATRFLRELFSEFVVCFVGYSHEDRMMEYLAKGLPSNARDRYIFTEIDSVDRWSRLRLTPILYPVGQHETVSTTLEAWGTWARDTPLGRAERIRRLGGTAPPVDPDDQDLLAASLNDSVLAPEVCALATTPDWIEWMFQQPVVHGLMGRGGARIPIESYQQVGWWIAEMAVDPEHFVTIYEAVSTMAQTTDPAVVSRLLWHLNRPGVDPECVSTWLRWILAQARRGSVDDHALELLWGSNEIALSWEDTMLLLAHLTSAWTFEEPSLFHGRQYTSLILGWSFREGMRRLKREDAHEIGELLRWLTSFFEETHRRLALGASGFDRWSFGRSSIAPHEQDSFGFESADGALIDCARDTLAQSRERGLPIGMLTRESWLTSRALLLQRLALHDMAVDPDVTADSLVAVVLDHGLTFETDLHHEVFEALAVAAPSLDDASFDRLVAVISEGAPPREPDASQDPEFEERLRDRKVYERLHWLLKHRPAAPFPAALEEIARREPEWAFDQNHADFTSYMEVGSSSIEDERPWTPDDFHAMVAAGPREALASLAEKSPEPTDFWWGGGDMVRATVEQWPDDGFALWAEASSRVRQCVVGGWAMASLSDPQMSEIVRLLSEADLTELGREPAKLLYPWSNDTAVRTRWIGRPDARHVARAMFGDVTSADVPRSDSDLYTQAINSATGVLAEFWLAAAGFDVRTGAMPEGQLSSDVAQALEELLRPSAQRPLALAPLVGQVEFLVRADPVWSGSQLLPAIDPGINRWAEIEPLWEILVRGRVSEQLLRVCLLDWLPLALSAAGEETKVANGIARLGAIIAVRSTMDDNARAKWARTLYARSDARAAVHWIEDVRHFVSDLEPDARLSLWHRWMRAVFEERLGGVPRTLTSQELTAFVGWIGLVDEVSAVEAAVDHALNSRKGFASFTDMWSGLRVPDEALRASPTPWARLLLGMLSRSEVLPGGLSEWLRGAAALLRAAEADEATVTALDAALFGMPRL